MSLRLEPYHSPSWGRFALWGEAVLGYLFPRVCPLCRCRLSSRVYALCPSCAVELSPYRAEMVHAEERLWGSPIFGNLYAPLAYQRGGRVQALVHALKYRGYTSLASYIATRGVELCDLLDKDYDYLIPIPLEPRRLQERGYNQASLLSRALSHRLGVGVATGLLRRHRGRGSQTRLGQRERRANVSHSFYLSTKAGTKLSGSRILLVDDVLTTGATLLSAMDTLEGGGVAHVDVFVASVSV